MSQGQPPGRPSRRPGWFERMREWVRDGRTHYYHCPVCDNEEEWFSVGPEVVLCAICGEPMDWVGVRER